MENKYYAPSSEEFYIGFEYQEGNSAIRDNITEWLDNVVEDKLHLKLLFDGYTHFRVKYLDRKDIESLGFNYTKASGFRGNKLYFEKESHGIILSPGIYEDDFYDVHIYQDSILGLPVLTRFFGEVKNKSELKKLLKMLNIK